MIGFLDSTKAYDNWIVNGYCWNYGIGSGVMVALFLLAAFSSRRKKT